MKMTILPRADEITHVVLEGRLDTTGVEEINEVFTEAIGARDRSAIVDLSQIKFMASRGIGLLITNFKRLLKTGHSMVLVNPQELVESVLITSGVSKAIPFANDLDEAVRILQGVPGPTMAADSQPTTPVNTVRPQRSTPMAATPSAIEGELRLVIQNEVSELKALTITLTEFLDTHRVPYRAAYAVNLAIDELVSNVIRYAYVDSDTHFIDLQFVIEPEQLILRIADDGRPFDPRRGPDLDLHAEDREAGGMGLLLVLDMVDMLKYQRIDDKNCVEVRVHLLVGEQRYEQSDSSGAAPQASHE